MNQLRTRRSPHREAWRALRVLVAAAAMALVPGSAADAQAVEDFVIEGEVFKPEITVLISRENLNKSYDIVFETSFLERIVESVESDPF